MTIVTFFMCTGLQAQVIGSRSQLLQYDQPLLIDSTQTNHIIGFTDIPYGLYFQDQLTTCTYGAMFGIAQSIDLNGGTLYLDSDLVLNNPITIPSSGIIKGCNHTIVFPQRGQLLTIPSSQTGYGINRMTDYQNCGSVAAVDWSQGQKYVACATAKKAGLSVLEIAEKVGAHLVLVATHEFVGSITDLSWNPVRNLIAIGTASGPKHDSLHLFEFNPTTNMLSECYTSDEIYKDVMAVKWDGSGKYLAVASKKSKEQLSVYALDGNMCYLKSTHALPFTRSAQPGAMAWNHNSTFLAIGMKKSMNRPEVKIFSFDGMRLACACEAELGATVQALGWSPLDDRLAVGCQLNKGKSPSLRLFNFDPSNYKLEELEQRSYQDSHVVCTLEWSPDGSLVAIGSARSAREQFLRIYKSNHKTKRLSKIAEFQENQGISSVAWSRDSQYLLTGLETNKSVLYRVADSFDVDNTTLSFHSDVQLNIPFNFTGVCSLQADSHQMIFKDSTPITVASNSFLFMQDTRYYFGKSYISLANATSSLFWQDCTISCLDGLKVHGGRVLMGGKITVAGLFDMSPMLLPATCIALQSGSELRGTWSVQGHVSLSGNGNALDVSSGTSFFIAKNSVLDMNDLVIKHAHDKLFICEDETSELHLSGVTIELCEDVTQTSGSMVVQGPSTLIVKNHNWTFDNDATLTVDGVVLWQDWAGSKQKGEILFGDPYDAHCSLVSSGTIRILGLDGVLGVDEGYFDLVLANSNAVCKNASAIKYHGEQLASIDIGPGDIVCSGGNQELSYDLFLNQNHALHFTQDTVVYGNHQTIYCSPQALGSIKLDAAVSVTFVDVHFAHFASHHFDKKPGSSVTLSGSSTLSLGATLELEDVWYITGNVELWGNSNCINCHEAGSFAIFGPSALMLSGVSVNQLRNGVIDIRDNQATVTVHNSQLQLFEDVLIMHGKLQWSGQTKVVGSHTLWLESDRDCEIAPCSTLTFAQNATLGYQPRDGAKHHLRFLDTSSCLLLDRATLFAGFTGLELIKGRLAIATVGSLASNSREKAYGITIGDGNPDHDMIIDIAPGALLDLNSGYVTFKQS